MSNPLLLVVDDHPSTQQLLSIVLGQEFQILQASNGEQALQLIAQHRPDVILLDWLMPGELTGLDVLKRIKASAEWRDIPVAMVTSQSDGPHIMEGFQNGADEFFVKPFKPLTVSQWVRQVVQADEAE